jgi:hypothetical protein
MVDGIKRLFAGDPCGHKCAEAMRARAIIPGWRPSVTHRWKQTQVDLLGLVDNDASARFDLCSKDALASPGCTITGAEQLLTRSMDRTYLFKTSAHATYGTESYPDGVADGDA